MTSRLAIRSLFAALAALALPLAAAGPAAASSPAGTPAPLAMVVPKTSGPIAYYTCPPAPYWCKRKLRRGHGRFPGVTIVHLRAHMRNHHGPTQDIYKVAWKLNDPWVHLDANPLNVPDDGGRIRLGTISGWSGWGAPRGFTAALNGDFFSQDWSGYGWPSGMLVHNRHLVADGYGGPAAGFPKTGGMVFGDPRAVPTKLPLPTGAATVGAFIDLAKNTTNQLSVLGGDQVAVYTQQGPELQVPAGYSGFVLGDPTEPTPFRAMLDGARGIRNSRGVGETVTGFRFEVAGAANRSVWLPSSTPASTSPVPCAAGVCPEGAVVTLGGGESMLIAKTGKKADVGLRALVQGSRQAVKVPLDDQGWQGVTEVMGGRPRLVSDGAATSPRANTNAPGMSTDCWQWCYQHWRPALAESKSGYGWLIITGGSNQRGVYGWDWEKMLVQLGARNAIGFDNNSSTEIFAPGTGMYSFYPHWQRSITEATSVSYRR